MKGLSENIIGIYHLFMKYLKYISDILNIYKIVYSVLRRLSSILTVGTGLFLDFTLLVKLLVCLCMAPIVLEPTLYLIWLYLAVAVL